MKIHNNPDNERIALLIYKQITGNITEAEKQDLKEWRKQNPQNENLYQRLLDSKFLEKEFRKYQNIEYARPMSDMKARIKRESNTNKIRFWKTFSTVAATLLFAVCSISIWMFFENKTLNNLVKESTNIQISEIGPGTTQALLTLNDGSEISLGADSAINSRLIAQNKKDALSSKKEKINNLTTPRGGEFMIMLEDSTKVWLNAESQLIYPESFSENERRVKIKGEAYFQVAKDKKRPFYVESSGITIRVYGTEFNINAYSEEKEIYTTLVSGSISLQRANESKSELILTPGHQAIYNKDNKITSVKTVNTEAITSWHNGRFVFEEQTLEQIMKTLARWYNFEYEFKNNEIRRTVFKGSAPRYGNLSEVLSILEKSGGIKFQTRNNKIIIINTGI